MGIVMISLSPSHVCTRSSHTSTYVDVYQSSKCFWQQPVCVFVGYIEGLCLNNTPVIRAPRNNFQLTGASSYLQCSNHPLAVCYVLDSTALKCYTVDRRRLLTWPLNAIFNETKCSDMIASKPSWTNWVVAWWFMLNYLNNVWLSRLISVSLTRGSWLRLALKSIPSLVVYGTESEIVQPWWL